MLRRTLFDSDLRPGDVLYVPAGFPHATSTASKSSLHLTFGLAPCDSFGLAVGSLRRVADREARKTRERAAAAADDPLDDPAALRELDPALFHALDAPLPLGAFLGRGAETDADFAAACRAALSAALALEPLATYRGAIGLRPPDAAAVDAAAARIRRHHAALLDEQRRVYADADGATAAAEDRVSAHLDALGALVDELWSPRLDALEARIGAATVVFRDRPPPRD